MAEATVSIGGVKVAIKLTDTYLQVSVTGKKAGEGKIPLRTVVSTSASTEPLDNHVEPIRLVNYTLTAEQSMEYLEMDHKATSASDSPCWIYLPKTDHRPQMKEQSVLPSQPEHEPPKTITQKCSTPQAASADDLWAYYKPTSQPFDNDPWAKYKPSNLNTSLTSPMLDKQVDRNGRPAPNIILTGHKAPLWDPTCCYQCEAPFLHNERWVCWIHDARGYRGMWTLIDLDDPSNPEPYRENRFIVPQPPKGKHTSVWWANSRRWVCWYTNRK
jgi:hypothetical protein